MNDICAFTRTCENGETLICIANLGKETKTFTHDIVAEFAASAPALERDMTRNGNTITLQKYGYTVLIKK